MVSVKWLAQNLGKVTVLDGTWALPPFVIPDKTPYEEFLQGRIPTARFWDLDKWSDGEASIAPHNLPTPAQFRQAADLCGLTDGPVVVYDQFGTFSAPKLWFTLMHFGLEASVLEGGLPAWIAAGHDLESGEVASVTSEIGGPSSQRFKQWRLDDVKRWLAEPAKATLIDARAKPRFDGTVPDPRGLRTGHIPGSLNLPFTALLDADPALASPDAAVGGGPWRGAKLKSDDDLRAVFAAHNVPTNGPLAVTCGSGMTAATVALALHRVGNDDIALYDGSWLEYAQAEGTPVESS